MSQNNNEKKFYPDYLFVIIIVIFISIEFLLILSLTMPQEIGRAINFSSPFQPKPEWYFLWLFEIMRYFPGDTVFIGTVVIPVVIFIGLLLIPFIDKGKHGRVKSIIVITAIYLIFIIFTLIAFNRPS
jgi:quinol-cytochrome oxidoreductase complex cytochrome b subunit